MKNVLFSLLMLSAFALPSYAAEVVPCENMMDKVKTEIKAAKLSDADAAKVDELKKKGIERCKADDDEHADGFFADALKIMGK